MKKEVLLDALVLTKRIGNLLNEVMDISQQMAEAVDRDDEVTVSMLISMRSEPIEKLKVAQDALQAQLDTLAGSADGERLSILLNGGSAAADEEESLAKQVSANGRQLEKIIALDRVLNQKIARDQSVYQK